MSGDYGEPTTRENQWVEKQGGGGVTRRKDQPTGGYGYDDGRKSKNETMAAVTAKEASEYRGVPVRDVIKEALPVDGVRPLMGTGRRAGHVETRPQTPASEPVVAEAVPVSPVVPNPWEGLGNPDRPVPEGGPQSHRPGSQSVKHIR